MVTHRGSQNPINLYECRLISAYRNQEGQKLQNLERISVGLDIVNTHGQVAYYDRQTHQIFIQECVAPWENWNIESLKDCRLFGSCLKRLKFRFEEMEIGRIDSIALVIPHTFTYLQKSAIVKIARSIGIDVLAMDSAGMFSSLGRQWNSFTLDKCDREIIYNLQDREFEISLIEAGNGVCGSLGTSGISCHEGWSNLTKEDFEDRIGNEIDQFFDSIEILKDQNGKWLTTFSNGNQVTYHVYAIGRHSQYLEERLFELTGQWPEEEHGIAAIGGLMQCMILNDSPYASNFLRLTTYNQNIWMTMGKNGKQSIAIGRYTIIPTRKCIDLLVSADKSLKIYEGHTMNPDLDCLLADISLEGQNVNEDQKITCVIDIDSFGTISISIFNQGKDVVIDGYQL